MTLARPEAARMANHSAMAGPNRRPRACVPNRWPANSTVSRVSVTGSTNDFSPGCADPSPSTDEMTLIAGVIVPSPKKSATPNIPSKTRAAFPDRQHERLQPRLPRPEPFFRRDDADRRGDRPVAEEERHSEYPQQDQGRLPGPAFHAQAQDKRDQSHDAALAPVVRAHDKGHVLDRDDQDDRPDNQRDHSVHAGHVRPDAVHRKDGTNRVQGARP